MPPEEKKQSCVRRILSGLGPTVSATVDAFTRRPRERLQNHSSFTHTQDSARSSAGEIPGGGFTYATPSEALLAELREEFSLEAIAGAGTEAERWHRLMKWVHQLTRRSANPKSSKHLSGVHLVRAALEKGQRFNCVMYATVLNEALLALGYVSRVARLYPMAEPITECHFVVVAFSEDLGKWVLLDADTCTTVSDEKGTPLHPGEIRECVIRGRKLVLSDSIRSRGLVIRWLLPRRLFKRLYLRLLVKNLFRFECAAESAAGFESRPPGRHYVQLIPDGYHDEWLGAPRETKRGNFIHCTRDETFFWGQPAGA